MNTRLFLVFSFITWFVGPESLNSITSEPLFEKTYNKQSTLNGMVEDDDDDVAL